MTEPFTWDNCSADLMTWRHGRMAQAFFEGVVEPSLGALNKQISEWSKSDDPAAPFLQDDTEELLRVTMLAFCLSIQSMWERQIRAYLRTCAEELEPDSGLSKKAQNGTWHKIDRLFGELRGIRLNQFDEYEDLDLLHLIGNACRHGDGPSAQELWVREPGLWPPRRKSRKKFQNPETKTKQVPSIDGIVISRELLRRFVDVIASFWDETEYIYLESLERKHESVETELIKRRRERAMRRNPKKQ